MKKTLILCLAALAGLAGGCGGRQQLLSGRMDKGLVIVLPGIEGRSKLNRDICAGLAAGGVESAVQLYDWTTPLLTPLYNLKAYGRNKQQAADIARQIVRYKMAYPDKPVVLVGQSGGGAIAVWAVEALPLGVKVDGVVLLAAALGPNYMLETALAKSKRGIVNFYSQRDWVLLGLGTTLAGTMDGEHTSSAGRTGFEVPYHYGRPSTYSRLFQIPWQQQMAGSGSIGTHMSSGAPRFVANYVAPFVMLPRWSEDIVDRVLHNEDVSSIMRSIKTSTPTAPTSPTAPTRPSPRTPPRTTRPTRTPSGLTQPPPMEM